MIPVNQDIVLYEIQLEDATDIYNTINTQRDYLGEWLPFVEFSRDKSTTESFIRSTMDVPEEKRDFVFVIRFQTKFAGIIRFKETDHMNHRIEIGYWLSKDFQNKGIIIQSIKKMIDFAFEELKMNRIQIKCAVGNKKSIRIPTKLNCHFEGIERDGELLQGGVYTDLEVYSLLKKEWKSK
ncbi:MAG: GNAT family N-acetyltransferase [Bacteroidales bacterium]|nr:GNAT family N-acetyltransferase [Bacteroidales bacterium]